MRKILTIAGSDCSGGAGIQADLKTMTVHGMYGMSVITALTAQNTEGVMGVLESTPEFVAQQIDCVFRDIRPDAVKIGMVSNADIIRVIADKLKEYKAENIVVDPVMVATSGGKLMQDDAAVTLTDVLMPLATVITPNIPEGEVLSGMQIRTHNDMEDAARRIADSVNSDVLLKGGHFTDCADDLLYLYEGQRSVWFRAEHIKNENTHGTGCTLSSAIACNLAAGRSVEDSVKFAKEFISGAIKAGLNLGSGRGPLNHMFGL